MSEPKKPFVVGAGVLMQLSAAIVTAIVVPLLVGIWVSRAFELGPIAIVCVVAVGVALGAAAVTRIIQNTYDQLGGGK